jgi:ABC-type glycerol-3-phosphate transport system permease component
MKRKKFVLKELFHINRIPIILWCAFTIFAIIWVVISSLKTNREFFSNVWGLFEKPMFSNYYNVLFKYDLGKSLINSIIIVSSTVAGLLLVSTPAAYVLSRIPFKGSNLLAGVFSSGMGIPAQLLLIPIFVSFSRLGLVNTYPGLIIIYITISIPFTVFLLMGFMRSLPSSLEEAATIDGASPFTIFTKVMLPLCAPGIVTACIYNFINAWNEFLYALVVMNDSAKYPLSVGIRSLQVGMQYLGDWVGLFAGFVVVIIPTSILYFLLSRRLIEGITLGAIKG